MTYEKEIDVDLFNQEQAIELEQDELECLSKAEQEDIYLEKAWFTRTELEKEMYWEEN